MPVLVFELAAELGLETELQNQHEHQLDSELENEHEHELDSERELGSPEYTVKTVS